MPLDISLSIEVSAAIRGHVVTDEGVCFEDRLAEPLRNIMTDDIASFEESIRKDTLRNLPP